MSDEQSGTKMKTRKVSVGGKPFSARNPLPIGAIGLVMIIALLWAAFNASSLPIIGSGTTYTAYFTEDANLRPDDVVLVAGVKVGTVETTDLDGSRVKVTFKIKNAFIGDESTLQIKLKTLLGSKYLAINSIGTKPQNPHNAIPTRRTASLFDVYPAFTELTNKINAINTTKLAQSFSTLADTFRNTPPSVRGVLRGLSRISDTISSRDQALRDLLARANDVTGVLASRDQQLQKLFSDGGLLLDELNARRAAIHSLLINTTTLSVQLEGLVHDNEKTIGPLLNSLQSILGLLNRNQETLDRGLALLGPFYRVFTNTIGNGRWFDNYICNFSVAGVLSQGSGSESPAERGCGRAPDDGQDAQEGHEHVGGRGAGGDHRRGGAVRRAQRRVDEEDHRPVRLGGRRLPGHAAQDPRDRRRRGHQRPPERRNRQRDDGVRQQVQGAEQRGRGHRRELACQ